MDAEEEIQDQESNDFLQDNIMLAINAGFAKQDKKIIKLSKKVDTAVKNARARRLATPKRPSISSKSNSVRGTKYEVESIDPHDMLKKPSRRRDTLFGDYLRSAGATRSYSPVGTDHL